jgi:hypothetical protein
MRSVIDMNDLYRDWHRWTRGERTFARLLGVLIVVGANLEVWLALSGS